MYVKINVPLFSDCPESGAETALNDSFMAILATLVLVFALFVFGISYVSDRRWN